MKRILICLVVLGLALSVVGCGATGGGDDDGDGVATYSISGNVTNAQKSGAISENDYTVNVSDVVVRAYTSASYSGTIAASDTPDCSGLSAYGGSVEYSLTGLPGNITYYIKATQTASMMGMTLYTLAGTIEVELGTAEVTGANISLSEIDY